MPYSQICDDIGCITGNRSGQVNEVASELHHGGPGQGFLCCGWLKLEIL